MAEITKHLGVALADARAGRITAGHLVTILQEAAQNGDILLNENRSAVIAVVIPLVVAGVLPTSAHVECFKRRAANEQSGRKPASPVDGAQSRLLSLSWLLALPLSALLVGLTPCDSSALSRAAQTWLCLAFHSVAMLTCFAAMWLLLGGHRPR